MIIKCIDVKEIDDLVEKIRLASNKWRHGRVVDKFADGHIEAYEYCLYLISFIVKED